MNHLPDLVTDSYAALLSGDADTASQNCATDVTCHVAGQHPWSGDYRGVAEITGVLHDMDEVGGDPSFSVTNVMSDDSGSQVLVEGVAVHGTYTRHVITRLRYDARRLAELWIKPLDQRAEDDFWCARMPQQRVDGSGVAVDSQTRSSV